MALMYPYVISCQCHPTNLEFLEFSQFFMYHVHSCATSGPPGYVSWCIDVSSEVFIFEIQYPRGPTPPQCWTLCRTVALCARPCVPARKRRTSRNSRSPRRWEIIYLRKNGNSTNHIHLKTYFTNKITQYILFSGFFFLGLLRFRFFRVGLYGPGLWPTKTARNPVSWVLGDMDWRFALQVTVFPCFPQMCPQGFLCWPGWFRLRVLVAFWLRRLAQKFPSDVHVHFDCAGSHKVWVPLGSCLKVYFTGAPWSFLSCVSFSWQVWLSEFCVTGAGHRTLFHPRGISARC